MYNGTGLLLDNFFNFLPQTVLKPKIILRNSKVFECTYSDSFTSKLLSCVASFLKFAGPSKLYLGRK